MLLENDLAFVYMGLGRRPQARLQQSIRLQMSIRNQMRPRAPIGASARRCVRRGANAREEICTVRGKHGIYGDERGKLTNNKSKGSKAQTQATFESDGAGRGPASARHRDPLFCNEIAAAPLCSRKEIRVR